HAERLAGAVEIADLDGAEREAGKRLDLLRVALERGAEMLRGAVHVARGEELLALLDEERRLVRLRFAPARRGDPLDEGRDLALRLRADEAVHRTAVDEGDDGGDRLDAELPGDGG